MKLVQISLHISGSNGNRYELSAEMPRVTDDHSEPIIWDDITKSMTFGVQLMPEGFKIGS